MKAKVQTWLEKARGYRGLDWIVLAFGLLVFATLVSYTMTGSGIWFDEAFSAYLVRFDFWEIARYTATDVHPPLYYWLLDGWTTIFGTTEVAFRSLSMVFGMGAITAGFLLVRRLFGRKAAWVSLLLLVLSPMLIRYGQEARMYTLAALIAVSATYALVWASESKKKLPWVIYGILVSLGMWTHYFTALVWLSHWAWRLVVKWQLGRRGRQLARVFFSKEWILAHVVAVGLYLPWVVPMAVQLAIVQGNGFWIGPVSAGSFTNFFTNFLFYLEKEPAVGLYGTAFVIVMALFAIFGLKLWRELGKKDRQKYLLIIFLAFLPMVILFLASTPPIKSSFVERYLIPSVVGMSLFAGVALALGWKKLGVVWRSAAIGFVAVCMMFGIANVYHFGNYNKNSQTKVMTRQVVQMIQSLSRPGEPIIAADPWVFYEGVFYETERNPIYFLDSSTGYEYGSLDMLKYSDAYKIKDVEAFAKEHKVVWYFGYTNDDKLSAPVDGWKEIQNFSIYNNVDTKNQYKAAEFRTN